jgi:hypothetical protein
MIIGPGDDLAWERLGDELMQRRVVGLHYRTRSAFCDARQINHRLVFDMEEHKRTNFGRATLLDFARAYKVTADSIEATLHGGHLEPLPSVPARAAPAPEATVSADLKARITALKPQIEAEIRREQIWVRTKKKREATGADIFADEFEAQVYDMRGALDERIPVIAFLRAVRTQEAEQNPGLPRQARLVRRRRRRVRSHKRSGTPNLFCVVEGLNLNRRETPRKHGMGLRIPIRLR